MKRARRNPGPNDCYYCGATPGTRHAWGCHAQGTTWAGPPGYGASGLFTDTDGSDPNTGGDPLDKNHGLNDFALEALDRAERDCTNFVRQNLLDLADAHQQFGRGNEDNGHDFWLSRNGHGTGFWDRGMGPLGDKLHKAAKAFGECWSTVGDDGLIYLN